MEWRGKQISNEEASTSWNDQRVSILGRKSSIYEAPPEKKALINLKIKLIDIENRMVAAEGKVAWGLGRMSDGVKWYKLPAIK